MYHTTSIPRFTQTFLTQPSITSLMGALPPRFGISALQLQNQYQNQQQQQQQQQQDQENGDGGIFSPNNKSSSSSSLLQLDYGLAAPIDHLVIDASSLTSAALRLLKGETASSTEREATRIVVSHTSTLVKRMQPRRSLVVLMDGSEGVWKAARTRGRGSSKKVEERALRGPGSSLSLAVEAGLLNALPDRKVMSMLPPEIVFSGSCTPGSIETKAALWAAGVARRRRFISPASGEVKFERSNPEIEAAQEEDAEAAEAEEDDEEEDEYGDHRFVSRNNHNNFFKQRLHNSNNNPRSSSSSSSSRRRRVLFAKDTDRVALVGPSELYFNVLISPFKRAISISQGTHDWKCLDKKPLIDWLDLTTTVSSSSSAKNKANSKAGEDLSSLLSRNSILGEQSGGGGGEQQQQDTVEKLYLHDENICRKMTQELGFLLLLCQGHGGYELTGVQQLSGGISDLFQAYLSVVTSEKIDENNQQGAEEQEGESEENSIKQSKNRSNNQISKKKNALLDLEQEQEGNDDENNNNSSAQQSNSKLNKDNKEPRHRLMEKNDFWLFERDYSGSSSASYRVTLDFLQDVGIVKKTAQERWLEREAEEREREYDDGGGEREQGYLKRYRRQKLQEEFEKETAQNFLGQQQQDDDDDQNTIRNRRRLKTLASPFDPSNNVLPQKFGINSDVLRRILLRVKASSGGGGRSSSLSSSQLLASQGAGGGMGASQISSIPGLCEHFISSASVPSKALTTRHADAAAYIDSVLQVFHCLSLGSAPSPGFFLPQGFIVPPVWQIIDLCNFHQSRSAPLPGVIWPVSSCSFSSSSSSSSSQKTASNSSSSSSSSSTILTAAEYGLLSCGTSKQFSELAQQYVGHALNPDFAFKVAEQTKSVPEALSQIRKLLQYSNSNNPHRALCQSPSLCLVEVPGKSPEVLASEAAASISSSSSSAASSSSSSLSSSSSSSDSSSSTTGGGAAVAPVAVVKPRISLQQRSHWRLFPIELGS